MPHSNRLPVIPNGSLESSYILVSMSRGNQGDIQERAVHDEHVEAFPETERIFPFCFAELTRRGCGMPSVSSVSAYVFVSTYSKI